MQSVMQTDRLTEIIIGEVRTLLGAESTLHLYTNAHDPEPGDEESDFTEAAYDTYAAADLTGDWAAPVMDAAGQWSTRTSLHEFAAPTSSGPFTIEGVYVKDDTEVVLAARFAAPVELSVGGDPLRVRVIHQQWSSITLLDVEGS